MSVGVSSDDGVGAERDVAVGEHDSLEGGVGGDGDVFVGDPEDVLRLDTAGKVDLSRGRARDGSAEETSQLALAERERKDEPGAEDEDVVGSTDEGNLPEGDVRGRLVETARLESAVCGRTARRRRDSPRSVRA